MRKELSEFPVRMEIPVQWGDMDSARHVNNIMYLRWSESARITYFEAIELNTSFIKGIGPILGWQDAKYIFPMTYPDTALVGVKVEEIKADRLVMITHIYSKRHQRLAVISKQTIVPYDYENLVKAAIPEAWLENIKRVEESIK